MDFFGTCQEETFSLYQIDQYFVDFLLQNSCE